MIIEFDFSTFSHGGIPRYRVKSAKIAPIALKLYQKILLIIYFLFFDQSKCKNLGHFTPRLIKLVQRKSTPTTRGSLKKTLKWKKLLLRTKWKNNRLCPDGVKIKFSTLVFQILQQPDRIENFPVFPFLSIVQNHFTSQCQSQGEFIFQKPKNTFLHEKSKSLSTKFVTLRSYISVT